MDHVLGTLPHTAGILSSCIINSLLRLGIRLMRSGMDLKCRLSFKYLYYAFWDISFRDMLLQGHSKRKLNVKEQILVHIYSVLLKQEYSSLPCTQIVKIDFLPTIETCFNCFGTLSSDANRHSKKDDKTAREIQKLRNLSRPPLPPYLTGEGCRHREIRLRGTKPSRLF